jgi:hypothetical protein
VIRRQVHDVRPEGPDPEAGYLQLVQGLSPLASGVRLLPLAVAAAVVGASFALVAAGIALLATLEADSGYAVLGVALLGSLMSSAYRWRWRPRGRSAPAGCRSRAGGAGRLPRRPDGSLVAAGAMAGVAAAAVPMPGRVVAPTAAATRA